MVKQIKAFKTSQGHVYESKAEAEEMEEVGMVERMIPTSPFYTINQGDTYPATPVDIFLWLKSQAGIYVQVLREKEKP